MHQECIRVLLSLWLTNDPICGSDTDYTFETSTSCFACCSDGVFIDADGLNEVDLGTGNAYNPEDALRLYFQTGSVVGRSYTQDGEFNNARVPISQLTPSSGASKMTMLIGNYNHYLNMIRADRLERGQGWFYLIQMHWLVFKSLPLNSNTATRHILQGSLYITKTLEALLRCADVGVCR